MYKIGMLIQLSFSILIVYNSLSQESIKNSKRHQIQIYELQIEESIKGKNFDNAFKLMQELLNLKRPTAFDYERASDYAYKAYKYEESLIMIDRALAISDDDFESDEKYKLILTRKIEIQEKLFEERYMTDNLFKFLKYIDSPVLEINLISNLIQSNILKIDKANKFLIFQYKNEYDFIKHCYETKNNWINNPFDSLLLVNTLYLVDTSFRIAINYNLRLDRKFDSVLKLFKIELNKLKPNKVYVKENYIICRDDKNLIFVHNNHYFQCRNDLFNLLDNYQIKLDLERRKKLERYEYLEKKSSNLYYFSLTGGINLDYLFLGVLFDDPPFPNFSDMKYFGFDFNFRYDYAISSFYDAKLVSLNIKSEIVNGRFGNMSNIITNLNYRLNNISFGPSSFLSNFDINKKLFGLNFSFLEEVQYKFGSEYVGYPKLDGSGEVNFNILFFPNFNDLSLKYLEFYLFIIFGLESNWDIDLCALFGISFNVFSGTLYELNDENLYGGLKYHIQLGFGKLGSGQYR